MRRRRRIFGKERRRRELHLLAAARHVRPGRLGQGDRQPGDRVPEATWRRPFHGDTIYGEDHGPGTRTPSRSKSDRGIVYVETKGYKQDGTLVCVFRRKGDGPHGRRTSRSAGGRAALAAPSLKEQEEVAMGATRPGPPVLNRHPAGDPSPPSATSWDKGDHPGPRPSWSTATSTPQQIVDGFEGTGPFRA